MYRPYTVVLDKEEKLAKAKQMLADPNLAKLAGLDDRQQEQFFKLLSKKLGLEYGQYDLAAWALDQRRSAHLRRVTA